jgi:hypothetical protein
MLPHPTPDDFEKSLSRQPLKAVPAAWREEILAAAAAVGHSQPSPRTPRRSFSGTLSQQLAQLLWPHPKAWAGLAAVWVLILTLNLTLEERPPATTRLAIRPSPEVMVELRQQRKLYAELMGMAEAPDADRPRLQFPKPRSERVGNLFV